MPTYKVIWEIEVDAEDHRAAARQALAYQRDPSSTSVVFDVTDENDRCIRVDLLDPTCETDEVLNEGKGGGS